MKNLSKELNYSICWPNIQSTQTAYYYFFNMEQFLRVPNFDLLISVTKQYLQDIK
jgi:hypothetical protein